MDPVQMREAYVSGGLTKGLNGSWMRGGAITLGTLLGIATLLDLGGRLVNSAHTMGIRMEEEGNLREKIKKREDPSVLQDVKIIDEKARMIKPEQGLLAMGPYQGATPLDLYSRRTGHANTWGGRRY